MIPARRGGGLDCAVSPQFRAPFSPGGAASSPTKTQTSPAAGTGTPRDEGGGGKETSFGEGYLVSDPL